MSLWKTALSGRFSGGETVLNCRLWQSWIQGVDKNKNLPTKSCAIIIARTTLKSNRKQVGFLPKQGGFFGQNVEKTLKPRRHTPFSGKIANWGLTRLTIYGILFSQRRLANSNHDAPKKGASASAPFHSSIPYSLFLGRMQHSGLLCIRCAAHRALVRHCAQMKTKTGHSAWPPECPDFCFIKEIITLRYLRRLHQCRGFHP